MSETNAMPNVTEKQKQSEAGPTQALDWGVGMLLNAQADLLAGAEATVTDWLRRRHEALADTRQLIARMHIGADPAEALKAQHEWWSRSVQRLATEAEAYHAVTQQILERAPNWFPQTGWPWLLRSGDGAGTASSQAAATRAAGRPLRMANKSD